MVNSSGSVEYVYAKTSGMLAKAFVGARANRLFQAKNLADLWHIVFNTSAPAKPETYLAKAIEKEAEDRFIKEYVSLMDSFGKPEPVALQLLHSFDFANIKKINFALRTGEKKLPDITDIGSFSQINYRAWPKLSKMTAGGKFDWFSSVVEAKDVKFFEHKLDAQYVAELWQAVQKTKGEARESIEELIKEQLIFNNIIWALRLRLYYDMPADEIIDYLYLLNINVKYPNIDLDINAIRNEVIERIKEVNPFYDRIEFLTELNTLTSDITDELSYIIPTAPPAEPAPFTTTLQSSLFCVQSRHKVSAEGTG